MRQGSLPYSNSSIGRCLRRRNGEDVLTFGIGNKTYEGVLCRISDDEEFLQKELKILNNERKLQEKKARDGSFHEGAPRKAALNQRKNMKEILTGQKRKGEAGEQQSKKGKRKHTAKQKTNGLKAKVEMALESQLASDDSVNSIEDMKISVSSVKTNEGKKSKETKPQKKKPPPPPSSSEGSSSSEASSSSSEDDTAPLTKEKKASCKKMEQEGRMRDTKTLRKMEARGPCSVSDDFNSEQETVKGTSKHQLQPNCVQKENSANRGEQEIKSVEKMESGHATETVTSENGGTLSGSSNGAETQPTTTNQESGGSGLNVCSRNMAVYPGKNFKCSGGDHSVVKVHDDYEVYVTKDAMDSVLSSKSAVQCGRRLLDAVYTREAILGSTLEGYPPRGKGKAVCRQMQTLPRLNPVGLRCILKKAKDLEKSNKKWRPKVSEQQIKQGLATRMCEMKGKARDNQK